MRNTHISVILILFFILLQSCRHETEIAVPLRLYAIADAHVGRCDHGETMKQFAIACNAGEPDVVLDLGDAIEGRLTERYAYETERQAALAQQRDWLRAWESIQVGHKEIALGNRDIRRDYPLDSNDWIEALGYAYRPGHAGSKLQRAFRVSNRDVEMLVVVMTSYFEEFDLEETMRWVGEEISDFGGDMIVFAAHHAGLYTPVKELLVRNNINTQAIYLHGHNHGPDTLVRDAWGHESEALNFPSFLVTDLMCDGIAAKFVFYPGGIFETYRLDIYSGEISEPVMHYQTRVQ